MVMDEKMDHGPILSTSQVSIEPEDTFKSLETKMALDGASLLLSTLPSYIEGKILPQEQDHEKATFVSMIKKTDGKITETDTTKQVLAKSRAYSVWPGIYIEHPLRIKLNEILPGELVLPVGTLHVVDHKLFLGTADGSVEIKKLTPEGKSSMDALAFINGYAHHLKQE
jgi:methionyl-tRNA formyltransferase